MKTEAIKLCAALRRWTGRAYVLFCGGLVSAAFGPEAWAVTCQNNLSASNPDSVYAVHGDGTVTDTRTGLMWKVCSEGQTWSAGGCGGEATVAVWASALSAAEAHVYAGHGDWRLPNIKELRSLVEECRSHPAVNDFIFPATPTAGAIFWSSTPYASVSSRSWNVSFSDGASGDNRFREYGFRVRFVRDGQSSVSLVNGTCGAADGAAVATAPTVNLCAAGTANPATVTGPGPWTWTCAGANGGTTASCGAPTLEIVMPDFWLPSSVMIANDTMQLRHIPPVLPPVIPLAITCVSSHPAVVSLDGSTPYVWGASISTISGTTLHSHAEGTAQIDCGGRTHAITVVPKPQITVSSPEAFFAMPSIFTVSSTTPSLLPNMEFQVVQCEGESVEVNQTLATSSTRYFRCVPTVPASIPNNIVVKYRGTQKNLLDPAQPPISLGLGPSPCVEDSTAFAQLRTQFGNRGVGVSKYGEVPFASLTWAELVDVSTTLRGANVCHHGLEADTLKILVDGLQKNRESEDEILRNLNAAIWRNNIQGRLKQSSAAMSVALDLTIVGAAISATRKVVKGARASSRTWRAYKKLILAGRITGQNALKIEAYSALSAALAVAADSGSMAIDEYYADNFGLTDQMRAVLIEDVGALTADGIEISADVIPFLNKQRPLSRSLSVALLKFTAVAFAKVFADAAEETLNRDTLIELLKELGSEVVSFFPVIGGLKDIGVNWQQYPKNQEEAFETAEKALAIIAERSDGLVVQAFANKLARQFQQFDDRVVWLKPAKNELNFGVLKLGTTDSILLSFQNMSSSTLTFVDRELDDMRFTAASPSCVGALTAGATCTMTVSFSANELGAFTSLLRINYLKDGLPYQTRIEVSAVAFSSLVSSTGEAKVALNSPNQAGTVALSVTNPSGNPSNCQIDRARITDVTAPLMSSASAVPSPPAAVNFPFGFVDFKMSNCGLGESQTVRIDYPYALPPKSAFALWKRWDNGSLGQVLQFGSPGLPADFTVSGNSITYTITDGGPGDMDGVINGKIVDPVGVGFACDLDLNGDGAVTPEKDALLLNRYLLGLRGSVLVADIPLGASRSSSQAVESFMGSAMKYDVFGRSQLGATALSDGLVLTRLMQGVPDAALLSGVAIPASSEFATAADIRSSINRRCGTGF